MHFQRKPVHFPSAGERGTLIPSTPQAHTAGFLLHPGRRLVGRNTALPPQETEPPGQCTGTQCEPHSWRHHATLWHKITAHLGGDHNHGAFCLGRVCLPVVQAPLRTLSPTTIACTASPLKGPTSASASEDVSTHRGAQCHVQWSTAHHHPCAQGLRREVRPRAFESHLAGDRPEAKVPPRHCDTWAK